MCSGGFSTLRLCEWDTNAQWNAKLTAHNTLNMNLINGTPNSVGAMPFGIRICISHGVSL